VVSTQPGTVHFTFDRLESAVAPDVALMNSAGARRGRSGFAARRRVHRKARPFVLRDRGQEGCAACGYRTISADTEAASGTVRSCSTCSTVRRCCP